MAFQATKETYGLEPDYYDIVDVAVGTAAVDAASGDVSHTLALPAGARVASASATVKGHAFHGLIANLAGARVTAASVVYGSGGATAAPTAGGKAFIVDFGRPVSVLDLVVTSGEITLVLPWLGIDFAANKGPATGTTHARLTGLESQKLFIQLSGAGSLSAANFGSKCTIATGTVPANLRASVNGRPPFWTHPGALTDSVEITGLAAELNAVVGGDAVLTVATDAPGVLELGVTTQIDHTAAASWGGQPVTDVVVAALEPVDVVVPFVGGASGTWHVSSLSVDVAGKFPPWRAYPAQTTLAPGKLGLKIDATFSAARLLVPGADAEVYGVALPLRVSGAAEVHVALVADDGGVPGSGKPLAASVLSPVEGWCEALFSGPVKLPAAGAWLVVQAKTGAVEWAAAAEPEAPATRTLGAAASARWAPFPVAAVAQARLLRKPFATENTPLLSIAGTSLDPGATVELATAVVTADHTLTLQVTAQSSGTLTLGPATAVYT